MAGRRKVGTGSVPTRDHKLVKEAAQEKLIDLVTRGYTITAALAEVDRAMKTYELWRRDSESFRNKVNQARALAQVSKRNDCLLGEHLDFDSWRLKYLKTPSFWHQLQWIDLLEGREPRRLHPNQQYEKGKKSRLLINTPPFHAKTQTVTIDYVTYRLCMDPGFRVILVSQSAGLAEDFLFGIKQRLSHPDYFELQRDYAPAGGWKATSEEWSMRAITFGDNIRPAGEKDPNVQALGMTGQIYGRRADLLILDDVVTEKNVREHEKQMRWLRREADSRLEMGGKAIVVGTRIAPVDLYSELVNPANYGKGTVPWTHFASPAILDEGDTYDEHVTLWPYAAVPWQGPQSEDYCECGKNECREGILINGELRYPRWDGVHLEVGPRANNNAAEWALVYQQSSVPQDATFPMHSVKLAINNKRIPGLLYEETPGHPPQGMHGMYVIGGCDPAVKGYAGLVVMAVDPSTGKRYLLNATNLRAPSPDDLNNEMRRLTEHYGINEWRVEKTGLLQFFTQIAEWRNWYANKGVRFGEHGTYRGSKWDPVFGIASMAPLFGSYDKLTGKHGEDLSDWRVIAPPLLELPRNMNDGLRALVHQLITWTPESDPRKTPQDMVMALWFAELAARAVSRTGSGSNIIKPFRNASRLLPSRSKKRAPVSFADYAESRRYG